MNMWGDPFGRRKCFWLELPTPLSCQRKDWLVVSTHEQTYESVWSIVSKEKVESKLKTKMSYLTPPPTKKKGVLAPLAPQTPQTHGRLQNCDFLATPTGELLGRMSGGPPFLARGAKDRAGKKDGKRTEQLGRRVRWRANRWVNTQCYNESLRCLEAWFGHTGPHSPADCVAFWNEPVCSFPAKMSRSHLSSEYTKLSRKSKAVWPAYGGMSPQSSCIEPNTWLNEKWSNQIH